MLFSLFGAEKIPFDSIHNIEKNIPNIILWAVPVMLFFTVIEMAVTYYQEKEFYEKKETIGSILVGLGNLVVTAALKLGLLYMCIWIYNLIPWRMELQWWTLIPCYIIYDFFSYWAHRVSHEQRFWWATHIVHHSGEHYNLTVSYRLSWIQHLKIIFFLPVAFMGFHPIIFFVTNQIAVLFQFWVHTEYIRRMPAWVEYIFATPSNHRVHHGSQEKYIDKNFGATFIFWDRIFGTFQPEEEPVIYGVTTNITNKANPFFINFHEITDMVSDVKRAKGFRKKFFYVFGSPVKIAEEKKELERQQQKEAPVTA
ncbi:sterol desaturase family protein [Spirosoma fluviale]|uniref:Sterol desaturase/sphingolipid hydroxylase, fatty acid hydroxylase superfamily n=1 Tax=Spirosoma fluviale TaxID=1597977 RepID=A0A286GP17_9BACT|nr:sterol desaturase family protein [Spirosoma fluviale]SOD97268.1 Sterol desaturase/sphingolipid hydroxylase, fatty acid hydroxylase superfamily [Spirosoma fluviale]